MFHSSKSSRKTTPTAASVDLDFGQLVRAVETLQRATHQFTRGAQLSASASPTASPAGERVHSPAAWARIERVRVVMNDKTLVPFKLPLRLEGGFCKLKNGGPAKKFVADGITGKDGRLVSVLVVPSWSTGEPMIVWAEGCGKGNFTIEEA